MTVKGDSGSYASYISFKSTTLTKPLELDMFQNSEFYRFQKVYRAHMPYFMKYLHPTIVFSGSSSYLNTILSLRETWKYSYEVEWRIPPHSNQSLPQNEFRSGQILRPNEFLF